MQVPDAYVGLDVHKETIAIAVADSRRGEQPRFWGNISNSLACLKRLVAKLRDRYHSIEFVYEAGPCGYGIYRWLTKENMKCRVVAPSRIPRCPGDRVKNDHRDSLTLARLARAGELMDVWVPDEIHEAMRDLVRARHAANRDLRVARQRIQSFLLRSSAPAGRRGHPVHRTPPQYQLGVNLQGAGRNLCRALGKPCLPPSWARPPVFSNRHPGQPQEILSVDGPFGTWYGYGKRYAASGFSDRIS